MNTAFLVVAGLFSPTYPRLSKVEWIQFDIDTRDRLAPSSVVDVSDVVKAIELGYYVEIGFPTNDGKYVRGQPLTVEQNSNGEKIVVPSQVGLPGFNFSDLPSLGF